MNQRMEKIRILSVGLASLLFLSSELACSKKAPPSLDQARPVMEALLSAERDHRGSRGTFWRDSQPLLDRDTAMKVLGVDIDDAPDFEFTIDPPETGMDTKLRVTARGKGEAKNVALICTQEANAPKADCTEGT
jgi:hypothetical protein